MKYPFLHDKYFGYNYFFGVKDIFAPDTPENETLIIKDTNNEYHIGYYRDGLYLKSGSYP